MGISDAEMGERVAAIRNKKGWSQLELRNEMKRLEDTGWSASTMSAIESGSRSLKATELESLLAVFGVGLDEFLGRKNPRKHATVTPQPVVIGAKTLGSEHLTEEANWRAARRLGISVDEVRERSQRLWGCSLASQRENVARKRPGWRELDESAKQRVRGHITRALVKELEGL